MNWLKALHLIGMILWTGGLLMLSRVLGYHAGEQGVFRERLSRLETRLHLIVVLPGLLVVLLTGLPLLALRGEASPVPPLEGWRLYAKLGLVLLLGAAHFATLKLMDRYGGGSTPTSPLPFKILHMALGALVIGIILLVKVR